MKRIAIIGGGISGLSAAFALEQRRRAGMALEYVVFEAGLRFGGVISTKRVDGCVVEAGPDSFLTEKPWATELCQEIGLGDQLIGSNDAARKTYIAVKDRLIPLPDGLMFMVPTDFLAAALSPLFSFQTKLRIAREWFHTSKPSIDESVASFIERHYGHEMVDRLADPLLSGVYGGDAASLSMRAVLPRFVEMEKNYGSLGRAMIAQPKNAPSASAARPLFTSMKDGMQQLVDGLLAKLDLRALRLNSIVDQIQSTVTGWSVSANARSNSYDAIILAVPAGSAAQMLRGSLGELASELDNIQYSSSITVALGYDGSVRRSLPPGFGFLVPRSENKRMIAATLVHNKFPHRASEDRALIRCFLGGSRDEPALHLADNEILRIVRNELGQILRLTAEPRFTRVYKWKSAMAQYNVGHLERMDRIESMCKQLPGLALAGNGYRGIGVPDCVRSGMESAIQALATIGLA